MNTYLIAYNANAGCVLSATFDADSPAHAVEQFISWAPVSPHDDENKAAIKSVSICLPVDEEDEGIGYATSSDGSWFGLDSLEIEFVSADVQDADEVEAILFPR